MSRLQRAAALAGLVGAIAPGFAGHAAARPPVPKLTSTPRLSPTAPELATTAPDLSATQKLTRTPPAATAAVALPPSRSSAPHGREARELAAALRSRAAAATTLAGRLSEAQRLAAGLVGGLARGLSTMDDQAVPGLAAQKDSIDAELEQIADLGEPAEHAEREARRMMRAIRGITAGAVDPLFPALLADAGAAFASITGRDPLTGERVQRGYHGMEEALDSGYRRAENELRALGASVDRVASARVRVGSRRPSWPMPAPCRRAWLGPKRAREG